MEGVPIVAQQVMNSSIHEEVCLISGLTSGLRIWHCHEQWHRSQRRLRSHVAIAVVQAGTCSSELIDPLAWELPCAAGATLKKKIKKKGKKEQILDIFEVEIGNFFHQCILQNLIVHFERPRVDYFTSFTYFHNGWYKIETEYYC